MSKVSNDSEDAFQNRLDQVQGEIKAFSVKSFVLPSFSVHQSSFSHDTRGERWKTESYVGRRRSIRLEGNARFSLLRVRSCHCFALAVPALLKKSV